ncbi:MAG: nucleotide-binding protein [Candidatus Bipolaricaulia bacterium]
MQLVVTAGKGGTGKTTVATSLALALQDQYPVQFLDCDVEEPDAHILLKPQITEREIIYVKRPKVDESKCDYCGKCSEACEFNALMVIKGKMVLVYDELCHGCGLCHLVCPRNAISEYDVEIGAIEHGTAHSLEYLQGALTVGKPLATPIIRRLKEKIDPQKIAILDSAPGTGCPVIETMYGSDFVLLVTEPTPFGLHDLQLTVNVGRTLGLRMGVVLNRAGVGDRGVEEYCAREGLPILMRIPMSKEIAIAYSKGIPLVEAFPDWGEQFRQLYRLIEDQEGVIWR